MQVPTKSIFKHDIFRTHDKIVYHRNLFEYFLKDLYIHLGNTLLVNDALYKCYQNPLNIIFVESYEKQKNFKNLLVRIIIPYLELFHYSKFNLPIFVEDNPFGTIRNTVEDDVKYKTLFEKCIDKCNVSFYKNILKSTISSHNFPFLSLSIFG